MDGLKQSSSRRMDSNAPHVLACRRGEGPPMAPRGWRWFTGKRAKDICFVSPSGDRFRSKITLSRYLATISDANAPSADEFLWRVHPTDFKNVPLPGVEKKHYAGRNIRSLVKEIRKRGRPRKNKTKNQQLQNLQQENRAPILGDFANSVHGTGNPITGAQVDFKQDTSREEPVSQGQKRKRPLRHKSKVCHFCGPLGHAAGHHVAGHWVHGSAMEQQGSMNYNCMASIPDDEKISTDLLKGDDKDSWSVANHATQLHEVAEILRKFLVEAGELREERDIQIDELRRILLTHTFTRERMKAFPKRVLSALVLLLRNEEAPLALGRRTLARLCTKWYCKYRRFWCLLEEHRIRSVVEKFLSDTSVLHLSILSQTKSEALKDQSMGDPSHKSQYILNHTGADSEPESSHKMKVGGIMESSGTIEKCKDPCYRDRPCKECREYQMIKDACAKFIDDELGIDKGIEKQSAVDCCEHPSTKYGYVKPQSIKEGSENQNVEMLFPSPSKKRISEEIFLAHKTQNRHSCVNSCDEAVKKFEDTSTHESSGILDQRANNFTVTCQYANIGDLFDVSLGFDAEDREHGGNQCLDKERINNATENSSAKPEAAVETGNCNCKSCCGDVHFCPGCMCYICRLSIQPKETWSYIKCRCYHIFHLECIIKERIGGVVKEESIDGEFACPVCSIKYDLFSFWRERLENASETEDKDILENHLRSAISAMNGTRRKRLKALHCRVLNVYTSVTHTACSELQQLLLSILGDARMRKLSKHIDGFCNKRLQTKEMELFEGQELVKVSREVADRDLKVYKKAQEMVATRKKLLAEAQENMKKAEAEMQLAHEQTKCSTNAAKKAKNRLELLKLYHKPKPVTKEQVETQRKLYEWEVLELRKIQRTMRNVNCCCEESLPQLSLLLESAKEQRQRVDVALRKMENMITLCDS